METIKISVEVSVNLSENTQKFLTSLFGNAIAPSAPAPSAPAAPASKLAPTTPAEPAPAKPTPQPAAPAQTQSDAELAPSAPAAPAASFASKSIEDVRGILAKRVNEHRDVIKQKLNELGAPSVTRLDPAKYDEMYNFLESL